MQSSRSVLRTVLILVALLLFLLSAGAQPSLPHEEDLGRALTAISQRFAEVLEAGAADEKTLARVEFDTRAALLRGVSDPAEEARLITLLRTQRALLGGDTSGDLWMQLSPL